MSNPATDKAQEAFEQWHRKQVSACSKCEEYCIHKPWERAAYSGGRADLLTELTQMEDAEARRIRKLAKALRDDPDFADDEEKEQAATDLTTLLDANQALRVRVAELESAQ